MTKELHLGQFIDSGTPFEMPLQAVTSSFAITGKKRTGKSNTSVVFCESLYDAGLAFVVIDPKSDWYGMRSGPDGKPRGGLPIPIFGGDHGDFPLSPEAGVYMAKLVVDRNLTAILDVSEFRPGELRRFVKAFLTNLYKLNRTPRMVVLEEAQEIAPQIKQTGRGDEGDQEMVAAVKRFVKLGGFKGLGTCLVTQRFQDVDKGVTTQVETIITHRTTGPQDKKAIKDWVDGTAEGAELVGELQTLGDGEAWVWSPHFLGLTRKVRMRRRRTFDSGATPKVGEPARVATLADLVDERIEEAMSEAIADVKAKDPKELQARIRELEAELRAERAREPEERVVEVDRYLLPDGVLDVAVGIGEQMAALGEVTAELSKMHTMLHSMAARDDYERVPQPPLVPIDLRRLDPKVRAEQDAEKGTSAGTKSAPQSQRPSPAPLPARTGTEVRKSVPDVGGGAAAKILSALRANHPEPLTQRRIAALVGIKQKTSTMRNALSKLRGLGLVEGGGDALRLTERGVAAAGDAPPLPTGAELIDYWRSRLGEGAPRRIFEVMVRQPNGMFTDEYLAAEAGIELGTSTMRNAMSKLRSLGLVDGWQIDEDFRASIMQRVAS